MAYSCECIECGHTISSDSHCADLTCDECGGQMRRKKRPGSGRNKGDAKYTHIAVIRSRDDFEGGSFEFEFLDNANGVWGIKGTLSEGDVNEKIIQRYEFSPEQFTVKQVDNWLTEKGKEFKKIIPAEVQEKIDEEYESEDGENVPPQIKKARNAVINALSAGKIKKPKKCDGCGKSGLSLSAHHYKGYGDDHLLDVKWLCRDCHNIADEKMKKKKKKKKASDSVSRADVMFLPESDFDYMRERFQRSDEGYLKGRAIVTNVGVFTYILPDGSQRRELRPPEEVFASDSILSLKMVPLTNTHPREKVDTENIKKLQAGYGGDEVRQDSYHLSVPLVITDPVTVEGIERGNKAISCGYMVDVEEKSGVWMGVPYDVVQRNIRYNHIAVNIERGRAGDDAVIKLDGSRLDTFDAYSTDVQKYSQNSREDSMPNMKKVTLDGVEYEAEAKVIEALHNTQTELKTKTDETGTLTKDKATIEAERDSLKDENDQLKKDKEAAEKAQPEKIKEAVDARILLVSAADKAGVEVKEDLTDEDIKKAVILKAFPKADVKLKDAETVYIDARYDAAVEYLEEKQAGDNHQVASDATPSAGDHQDEAPDADKSYANMVKRMKSDYLPADQKK